MTEFYNYSQFVITAYLASGLLLSVFALFSWLQFRKTSKLLIEAESKKVVKN